MELFSSVSHIDFMAQRGRAFALSAVVLLVSIGFLLFKGLNLGLDFTGGVQLEISCMHALNCDKVRQTLADNGLEATVQNYGSNDRLVVRTKMPKGMELSQLSQLIMQQLPDSQLEQTAVIGGQAGRRMLLDGALAVVMAVVGTIIYVAFRFEYHFALAAALALLHDPIVILGVFAASGMEFDLITLVAVLTIIGYSLNDTIVIYDRARENFIKHPTFSPVEVLNLSVNQTLSRTIILSGTTLAVVLGLLVLGGEMLRGFSVALLVGIVVGTYSSVYIAGSLSLLLGLNRARLLGRSWLSGYGVKDGRTTNL